MTKVVVIVDAISLLNKLLQAVGLKEKKKTSGWSLLLTGYMNLLVMSHLEVVHIHRAVMTVKHGCATVKLQLKNRQTKNNKAFPGSDIW